MRVHWLAAWATAGAHLQAVQILNARNELLEEVADLVIRELALQSVKITRFAMLQCDVHIQTGCNHFAVDQPDGACTRTFRVCNLQSKRVDAQ